MIRHRQIRQTRVLHTPSWMGCLFRCCRRKTIICFVILATAFMVMIQVSFSELNVLVKTPSPQSTPGNTYGLKTDSCSVFDEFYSIWHFTCSANRDVHVRTDAQGLYRGLVNNEGDISFHFLTSIFTKVYAGWLQGRTTKSKVYFDELYISLGNQLQSKMQETEIDRWLHLQNLSRIVRKKIDEIQNPRNCDEARLLVYDINRLKCGFGCVLHTIMYLFMQSIYTNRTFVLQSAGWNYDKRGWEHYLMPFGKCKYKSKAHRAIPKLSEETEHLRVVTTDQGYYNSYDWQVPAGILRRLKKIHLDPYAWWVGQFVNYGFRLQPWFKNDIQRIGERIGFTNDVVGIHVRWGDKIDREAKKHEVDEYMDFVETWYRRKELEGKDVKRVVFVATENSEVWIDLRKRYPAYHFIGSGYVSMTKNLEPEKKASYHKREFALESILADMYFLSKCAYVVCTVSSEVCTAVYELLMSEKADAYYRLQSLDLMYMFSYSPRYRIIESHKKSNKHEMSVRFGDVVFGKEDSKIVRLNGYHRVGFLDRPKQQGEVPIFKLEKIVKPLDESTVFDEL